jgi:hypothetical protein
MVTNKKPINKDYYDAKQFVYEEYNLEISPTIDTGRWLAGYSIGFIEKAKYGNFEIVSPNFYLDRYTQIQEEVRNSYLTEGDEEPEYASILQAVFCPQELSATAPATKLAQILTIHQPYIKRLEPQPVDNFEPDCIPTAYIPNTNHINPKLKDLEITDILTIFPSAEQKALALSIGRGLTGIEGDIHCHTGLKVGNQWRYMVAINGDPAVGKSYLMSELLRAACNLGYNKSEFTNMGKQFGQAQIVSKDFAYSDDLTTKTLSNLLSSNIFKSVVSSSLIRTEEKNKSESEVRARSLIIANVNKFDSSILHSLDEGSLDRLLVLKTYSTFEVSQKENLEKLTGLSAGSPHLGTYQHLNWLAKTYKVSLQDLFNAFFRKCVDYYLSEVNHGILRTTMVSLKSYFRFQLPANVHSNFVKVLQLSQLVTTEFVHPPALSGITFSEALQSLNFFLNSAECFELRNQLKYDWLTKGRSSDHPWQIAKNLNVATIYEAAKLATFSEKKDLLNANLVIKNLLENVRLGDGFKVSSVLTEINAAWSNTRFTINSEFCTMLEKCTKVNVLADFDVRHLFSSTLDREAWAEELSKKAEQAELV